MLMIALFFFLFVFCFFSPKGICKMALSTQFIPIPSCSKIQRLVGNKYLFHASDMGKCLLRTPLINPKILLLGYSLKPYTPLPPQSVWVLDLSNCIIVKGMDTIVLATDNVQKKNFPKIESLNVAHN